MKNLLMTALLLTTSAAFTGGHASSAAPIGGQRDTYGCLSAAGQSWSVLKKSCVQPWSVADLRLKDATNPQQAVYVAFSRNGKWAELLGTQVVLHRTGRRGNEYVSDDKTTRLIKTGRNWSIKVQEEAPIAAEGGDRDKHGCLSAAGQTWSALRGGCVQVFDVADIRLQDPKDPTLGVFVLLSKDGSKAELFGMGHDEGVLLNQTATGYSSTDGAIQLEHIGRTWKLR